MKFIYIYRKMDSINEENILAYKEYLIKKGKEVYNLILEIDQEYFYLILKKINNSLKYSYRNKVKIIALIDELKLDQKYKIDISLLLKIFDRIYEENKIIINIKDKKNINIEFENSNKIKYKIDLIKENLTIDEKLNIIYNEIRLKNHNNYNYKIENNIKFEYLNNKIYKKDRILNEKEEKKEININENNKDIKIVYKKIEELINEQKNIFEKMIKEIKNIIEKNNNVKIHINEEKEYNKEINNNIKNNPTPFGDDKEIIIKKHNFTNMSNKFYEFKPIFSLPDISQCNKTWQDLGVKENIIKCLLEMDFIEPSKIQSISFPLIIKEPRLSVIAQAKNSSGKTGAFGLGVISSIDENSKDIQAVILGLNRELIIQIKGVLEQMAKYTKIKITRVLKDEEPDEYGQIVLMTPIYFEIWFLKKNKSAIKNLKMMVLDDADEIIKNETSGPAVKRAFHTFKKKKMNVQILFFSATFNNYCLKFIKDFYKPVYMIELKKEELILENITQLYQDCKTPQKKIDFIETYLKISIGSQRVIIFVNTRDYVLKLKENWNKKE